MPRNGSGTYTLPGGINPVITQTLITSNWANTTMGDIATALTQSLARDGQTLPTANLPMGGFRHTGAGNPVGLQDYTTLSFSQQGLHTRLTSVSGSPNAITANLVGGSTTFAVGQLVQLVPALTNTGAVTISINGGAFVPILSATGGQLGATNLQAGQVYLLSWNGAAWNILTSPDLTSFAQSAISGWFRPTPGGPYPDITLVNPNTIAIPAGSGRIIAPSTRDITGVTEVTWPAQNYVLTNIATQWQTTIGINALGQVVEFSGNVNSAWARTNIILGTIGHINGAIQFISNKPLIYGDVAYMAYDLGILNHNRLVDGGRVTGNVGNPIHIDIAAGTLWVVGGAADNTDSPNLLNFPQNSNANFWPVTTTIVGAITQNVPVANYDPGGAGPIVAIPGGGATSVIHRLYLLAGQLVFSYGQFTYATLDDAANNLARDDTAFTPPAKLVDATFVAWIVARKDATDLNNPAQARLINAGSAGGGGGGGGGSGIPDAPLTGQSFGRNNGVWVLVVDAVQAGSNISVDATNPNKPIVNMPSGNLVAGTGISFGGTGTNRLVGAVGNLTISANSQGDGDLVAGQGITLGGTLADRLVGPGDVTITASDNPAASFKNKLINGRFDFWQRGNTFNGNMSQYTADRWSYTTVSMTGASLNRTIFAVGDNSGLSDAQFCASYAMAGNTDPVNHLDLTIQTVEDVRTLANQTTMFSFRVFTPAAGRFISVEAQQFFGTGGAPSPTVFGIGATKIPLTGGVWETITVPIVMPDITGKTLGTDGNHWAGIAIWFSAGTAFNARTASLGPQTGDVLLTSAQWEKGTVATPFEIRPFAVELGLCQRYYEKSYNLNVPPGTTIAGGADGGRSSVLINGFSPSVVFTGGIQVFYKVSKRNNANVTTYSPITGASGVIDDAQGAQRPSSVGTRGSAGFIMFATAAAASANCNFSGHWVADAEL